MPATPAVRDRAPRLSASGYHQLGCPSSYARELEYYAFIVDKDIAGIQGEEDAQRGTLLHGLLAQCPLSLPDWGVEPYDVSAKVRADAKAQGLVLTGYECWLLTDMVRKREDLIGAVLDRHPAGRSQIETLDVFLDERRVGIGFDRYGNLLDPMPSDRTKWPESHTGLADVLAVAYGQGITTCGILDYKTGFAPYDSTDNRQLERLLATFSLEEKTAGRLAPQSGLVAIACADDAGKPLVMAEYSRTMIEERERWLLQAMRPAIALASEYRDGPSTPTAAFQAQLDKTAKIGDHCTYCDGKICCGRFRADASRLHYAMEHKHRALIDDRNLLNPATVTTKDLTDTIALGTAIHSVAKLYERTLDEASELARQLRAKGATLEGIEFKPGTKRLRLSTKEGREVHAMLEPLLREDYPSFAAALADAKVDPYAVRTHVAERLGIADNKVVETINAMQPGKNPLEPYETDSRVMVTADLSDIVTDLTQEVTTRAATTAAVPPPALAVTPATAAAAPAATPAGATSTTAEDAPAPKRRRRSPAKAPAEASAAPQPSNTVEIAPAPSVEEIVEHELAAAPVGASPSGWD